MSGTRDEAIQLLNDATLCGDAAEKVQFITCGVSMTLSCDHASLNDAGRQAAKSEGAYTEQGLAIA